MVNQSRLRLAAVFDRITMASEDARSWLRERNARFAAAFSTCIKSSAAGAKELSPALERWVGLAVNAECRRHGRPALLCRPDGTRILSDAFPALKRWAKLFRPASGARPSPLDGLPQTNRDSNSPQISLASSTSLFLPDTSPLPAQPCIPYLRRLLPGDSDGRQHRR